MATTRKKSTLSSSPLPTATVASHCSDLELFSRGLADFPDPTPLASHTVIQGQDTVEILTRDVNAAIQELLARNISLARLQIRPRTLEDLFLELTGRELRS